MRSFILIVIAPINAAQWPSSLLAGPQQPETRQPSTVQASSVQEIEEDDQPWTRITPGPKTTRIMEPLDEWGYVDFVEALNQMGSAGVTPENNAAVLLVRARGPRWLQPELYEEYFRRLGIEALRAEGDYLNLYDLYEIVPLTKDYRKFSKPWTRENSPRVAAWLDSVDEHLELAHKASRMEQAYFPLIGEEAAATLQYSLESHDLNDVIVRDIVKTLHLRAMLHLGENRACEAIEDLLACERLARLICQERYGIVSEMKGLGIAHGNLLHWAEVLGSKFTTAEQAKHISRAIQDMRQVADPVQTIDVNERYLQLAHLQFYASRPLHSLGDMSWASWLPTWLLIDWNKVALKVNGNLDLIAHAAGQTRQQRLQTVTCYLDQLDADIDTFYELIYDPHNTARLLMNPRGRTTRIYGHMWSDLTSPNPQSYLHVAARQIAQQDLLVVAAALVAFQREQGAYPETLDQLSPAYLTRVPEDPFADETPEGEMFQYRPHRTGFVLYSIGNNGKDDDASEEREDKPRNQLDAEKDIVLRIGVVDTMEDDEGD